VHHIDPITLTGVRIFTAGVVVLLIAKVMGIFRFPTKREWKTIAFIMIFNVVFHHTILAIGLTKTSGVNTVIILVATRLVTIMLLVIFLRDHVTRLRAFGFVLGFVGIIFTSIAVGEGVSSISFSDVYIFLSMFFQAISFILISV